MVIVNLADTPLDTEHNLENAKGANSLAGTVHQEVSKYMKDSVEGNYINFLHLEDFVCIIISMHYISLVIYLLVLGYI